MTVPGLQTKSLQLCAYGFVLFFLSAAHLIAQDAAPAPAAVAETTEVPVQAPGIGAGAKKPGVTNFGKISVVGSRQNIRGGIASIAEEMRVELGKICGDPKRKMKLPLIIQLREKAEDKDRPLSVASGIRQIQGQYQVWIYVNLAKGIDRELLRYHLMEMFLYERGLGEGQVVVEGDRVLVKPWMIVGMLEAIAIKGGKADRRIYQADLPYLEILPLQKIFDSNEKQWRAMIGREPIAFRAISGAMVNSLFRQPDGRPGMAGYIAEMATFKGENENLMRKHFPGMNKSKNSLQKWVNLELVELGTARMTQVHSIQETDKRLDAILKLRYRDEKGAAVSVEIDGYAKVMKLKPIERFEAAAGARAELERLSYRCFPTYRPLLGEYEMILRDVILGKDADIKTRLSKLMDVRLKMKESAKRARDYLDWYYITQSNELSGDFEKYRALIDALEKEKLRPPADDSTQLYLDAIQRFYGGRPSKRGNR